MTFQDKVADLRAQLVSLRLLLHARRLQIEAFGAASGAPREDLLQPVMNEIAGVKKQLDDLGYPCTHLASSASGCTHRSSQLR